MEDAEPLNAAALQVHVGEVNGVFDVAVFQVVPQLLRRHDGAVLLALRGGGPQVGHGHHVGVGHQLVGGEVGDVGRHLPRIQGGEQGLVVHDAPPGQVDNPDAGLHGGESVRAAHVAGLFVEVDVGGDIVRLFIELIHVPDHMDMAVQPEGGVHGEEGVVAVHVHA